MTPKSQRKWALESTIAIDNSSSNINTPLSSQFASSLSIHNKQQQHPNKQASFSSRRAGGDWYGISGPFLVRQAFRDLSKKCDGRVVFVSVAGTSGILDLDLDNDHDDGAYYHSSSHDGNNDAIQLFRRNGACVDLNSNPFGWNDQDEEENQNSCNNNSLFSTKATLSNLQSIATAIRQAASRIVSKEGQSQQQQQQPIPIIFDSLTPLLHLHGAERITILLKSLGRTTTTTPQLHDNNNNNNASSSSLCVLSPIIAPVLYESICLSDHRTLEDCADAMVSLNLIDSTTTTSTNYAIEGKDDNSVVVVSGVLDLIRRGGGGGGNGLGGKLMRHCVPVQILRSLSTTGDLRDGCYWIIDSGDSDNGDDDAAEKGRKQTSSTSRTEPIMGQSQSKDSSSSRPKIFLEDDDPEFQDYDEDDDLDL